MALADLTINEYLKQATAGTLPLVPVLDFKQRLAIQKLNKYSVQMLVASIPLSFWQNIATYIQLGEDLKIINESGQFVIYKKDTSGEFAEEIYRIK